MRSCPERHEKYWRSRRNLIDLVRDKLSDSRLRKKGSILTSWRDSIPLIGKGISMRGGEVRSGSLFSYVDREAPRNETHRSTTDDDARLFRKGDGQASRLCFIGHVLMENRNGLAVDTELTRAAGAAERLAALAMAENLPASRGTRRSAPTRATTPT